MKESFANILVTYIGHCNEGLPRCKRLAELRGTLDNEFILTAKTKFEKYFNDDRFINDFIERSKQIPTIINHIAETSNYQDDQGSYRSGLQEYIKMDLSQWLRNRIIAETQKFCESEDSVSATTLSNLIAAGIPPIPLINKASNGDLSLNNLVRRIMLLNQGKHIQNANHFTTITSLGLSKEARKVILSQLIASTDTFYACVKNETPYVWIGKSKEIPKINLLLIQFLDRLTAIFVIATYINM